MKKGITFIEVAMITCIIVAILCLWIMGMHASYKPGDCLLYNGQKVYVVTREWQSDPPTYVVRKADGTEIHVLRHELTPIPEKQ